MKNKYIQIAFSIFLFGAGLLDIKAQETPFLQFGAAEKKDTVSVKKMSMYSKITKTPWVIQFGPDIVDDNDTRLKEFKIRDTRNYYPIHCSAEKRIKKGWSIQTVLSSETLNPHSFGSFDLNSKYSFLKSINDTKWFDPYALFGAGYTYRDFPHGQHQERSDYDNSCNANIGGGVNIWFFKNAGIYLQTLAKFDIYQSKWGGSNYIQFSAGVVFKIGEESKGVISASAETKLNHNQSTYKRSKEAEDAAKYLRDILNK